MEMLAAKIDPIEVKLSDDYGVGSDWVEGVAFAWLAKQTLLQLPGNAPLATGASHECILGGIYHP
jgi:anhydro-N-acetylmuramic acid kinase